MNTQPNDLNNTNKYRLIWVLDPAPKRPKLYPIEQIETEEGWKYNKELTLNEIFYHPDTFNYFTETDKKVCRALRQSDNQKPHYRNNFTWNICDALQALIDYPHVYHIKDSQLQIQLIPTYPALTIRKNQQSYHVKLQEHFNDDDEILLRKVTTSLYEIIIITREYRKLQNVLTTNGLYVNFEDKHNFLAILGKVSNNLNIYVEYRQKNLITINGNTDIYLRLMPYRHGIKVVLFVKPNPELSIYFKPCEFPNIIVFPKKNQHVQIVRDFNAEQKSIDKLLKHCDLPTQPEHIYFFPELMNALTFLEQLQSYTAKIHVEWPKGETLQMKRTITFADLRLQIRQKNDWFNISGTVKLGNKEKISLNSLLEKFESTSERYIQLDEGKFLALTEQLKKQLSRLKRITESNKTDIRIHKFGCFALQNVLKECNHLKTDSAWEQQISAIRLLQNQSIEIPEKLTGNLRSYQKEGFCWLARLTNWNFGACLADDMGLGKTIQAIAVLLHQSEYGPSLVITPTSVCYNWVAEINKFAPTLRVRFFSGSHQTHLLKKLQNGDVIVCSYGILQYSSENITPLNWQVIIIDEAQAIKNPQAKRTKAVLALKTEKRIALTGTPIENHLSELWSLFRFLNPGLLGSEQSFFKRFITPIEQHQDEEAQQILKRLVQPFILRRLKEDVLTELPSRTEKLLTIPLSTEERNYYEKIRINAITDIKKATSSQEKNTHTIKILTQITRLRQVCCHPKLLNAEFHKPSSKLKSCIEIITEIVENNHKALIFSQFVSFLRLVRESLDERNISYHYLDGQTSSKKRRQFVTSFQAGNNDLFLLSLKAGGIGLNLTAADYVVILDPWWNPAVEEQATDRIYRIGQTKPVTIYRLIMKDTIEEKILELHKRKRDLADNLLNCSANTGGLSESELLELIINE